MLSRPSQQGEEEPEEAEQERNRPTLVEGPVPGTEREPTDGTAAGDRREEDAHPLAAAQGEVRGRRHRGVELAEADAQHQHHGEDRRHARRGHSGPRGALPSPRPRLLTRGGVPARALIRRGTSVVQ